MTTFAYKASNRDGTVSSGTVSAMDRAAALRQLDAMQLQPMSLSEAAESGRSKVFKKSHHQPVRVAQRDAEGKVRLKPDDILSFTEELSQLLQGGIPLENALGIIERREGKSRLPAVAKQIRVRVCDGETLADSLRASSPDFGELYCRLVSAGEQSGALDSILARHAQHLKAVQGLKNKVVFALIYPAFLTVAAIGVTIMFIVFLIPKLMELLDTTGGSLPAGAEIILGLGEFFQKTWFIWVALVLGLVFFCRWYSKNRPRAWDCFKMKLPLLGPVLHGRQRVQFLETMAGLTQSGLPIVQGLRLTGKTLSSPVYANEMNQIQAKVEDGALLSQSLSQTENFPYLMADLVAVGEQTGDLGGSLERAAERYDADLTKRVDRVSAIIQPAVVALMAALVGCMAYLMVSAIFQTM
ncbi:MAG: type II secretion system F family protein, partial [Verrucomicrobiota bacterium]